MADQVEHNQQVQPARQPTDTLGVASICVSSFSVLLALLIPILSMPISVTGLVLGIVGEKNAKREGRQVKLSRIGWILGIVATTISVLSLFVGLIFMLLFIAGAD